MSPDNTEKAPEVPEAKTQDPSTDVVAADEARLRAKYSSKSDGTYSCVPRNSARLECLAR